MVCLHRCDVFHLVCSHSLALVESVRDGSTVRVRLMLPNDVHQIINLSLAGVRSPKASGREGEITEPWGEEVSQKAGSPGLRELMEGPGKIFH